MTKLTNWGRIKGQGKVFMATTQVNLYEAKTHLSSLLERAAKGEEIIIAKAGKPMARLAPLEGGWKPEPAPLPFGQNLMGITFLSDDWKEDLPIEMFESKESVRLFLRTGAK